MKQDEKVYEAALAVVEKAVRKEIDDAGFGMMAPESLITQVVQKIGHELVAAGFVLEKAK